jgi:hypothetical protein
MMQSNSSSVDQQIHILIMQNSGQRKLSLVSSDILRFEHCVECSSVQHLKWDERIRSLFVTFGRSPVTSDFRIRIGVCLPRGDTVRATLFLDSCPASADIQCLTKAIVACQSEINGRQPPVAVIIKRLESSVAPFLCAAPEVVLRREVSRVFGQAPLASIVMLSAIYSAAASSRRAFLCRPFPAMFCSNQQCNYDNLTSALDAIGKSLRRSGSVVLGADQGGVSAMEAAMSLWMIDLPCSNASHNASRVLDGVPAGPNIIPPICIELGRHLPPAFQTSGATHRGYHGTAFENVYSILLNGLQNYSGTDRMGTGDVFGNGIYLSGDSSVARSFSKPGQLIDGGGSVSAVFECLILKDPSVICSATGGSTPSSYFIVPREELVIVTSVWIWRSHLPRENPAAPENGAHRDDFSLYLQVFALLMLSMVCWMLEHSLRLYLNRRA